MVLRSKRDYLEAISSRYQRAGRNAKTIILDEFCKNCGYNRKYAIRLLRKLNKRSSGKSGERPGLGRIVDPVRYLAESGLAVHGERLQPFGKQLGLGDELLLLSFQEKECFPGSAGPVQGIEEELEGAFAGGEELEYVGLPKWTVLMERTARTRTSREQPITRPGHERVILYIHSRWSLIAFRASPVIR